MCDLPNGEASKENRPVDPSIFVDQLVVCLTNARIYWQGHPRVASALDQLHESFQSLAARRSGHELVLGITKGYLFVDGRPLLGATLSASRLLQPLATLNAGGISFGMGASRDELAAIVGLLHRVPPGLTSAADANNLLAQQGCTHVRMLRTYSGYDISAGDGDTTLPPLSDVHRPSRRSDGGNQLVLRPCAGALASYQGAVELLQDASVAACRGGSLSLARGRHAAAGLLSQLQDDPKRLMGLSRYEQFDAFTFGHSIRVCLLALDFARQLTDDEEFLQRIGTAALFHDIGKAWVPFDVLYARGRLTPEERAEIERHTVYGGEILLEAAQIDPVVVAAAFGHHRTLDGQGYPKVVVPTRQSAATKIVKICDVFEALTAVRPYKPRMSPLRAYRIMMGMRNHFEPTLLRRFISAMGLYPVGSLVQLDSGFTARIHEQTDNLDAPIVDLVQDPDGDALPEPRQIRVDLRDNTMSDRPIVELLPDANEVAA